MVQNIVWFLLVVVICLSQTTYGISNDLSKEDDRAFGYEILQVQLEYLKNSQSKIEEELTMLKETTAEATKTTLEKQNSLMEQLLGGISRIANNTSQDKIADELSQMKNIVKISVEKQSSTIERLLDSFVTIANNTNQNKIADELEQIREILHTSQQMNNIQSCMSASFTGLYKLICFNCPTAITVYCEMNTFEGGWLVMQQRLDGSLNFSRNWNEYKDGFGTVGISAEFWLGLETLHKITNSGNYELSIEVKDENGTYGYARYSDFKIAGEEEKYQLSHLEEHNGTNDALSYHKGRKFTTYDQNNTDNDDKNLNCPLQYHSGGGWWYGSCASSVLTGAYHKNNHGFGIWWGTFTKAASYSRMMIRRK